MVYYFSVQSGHGSPSLLTKPLLGSQWCWRSLWVSTVLHLAPDLAVPPLSNLATTKDFAMMSLSFFHGPMTFLLVLKSVSAPCKIQERSSCTKQNLCGWSWFHVGLDLFCVVISSAHSWKQARVLPYLDVKADKQDLVDPEISSNIFPYPLSFSFSCLCLYRKIDT